MYLNKATIIGNITRDPELKSLPSGIKVCSFTVATNRTWKDKDGQRQESADYHNVVVFGKQGDSVAQYMKKGSQILVEGRIQTRSWDDKTTGEKKYRTEIVADNIQFGNKSTKTETVAPKEEKEKEIHVPSDVEYPTEDINTEDIPF